MGGWGRTEEELDFFFFAVSTLLSILIQRDWVGSRIPNSEANPCPIRRITKHMGQTKWTLSLIKTDNSILRLDKLKNSHIERFLHLVNFLYNMKGSYSYYFFVLLHNSCFRCSIFRTNFEIPAF